MVELARQSGAETEYHGCRVVHLAGTSAEIGLQHGIALADEIRAVVDRSHSDDERSVRLVDLSVACAELYFGEYGVAEIQGIAEGAGVCVEDVFAHNLRQLGCAGGSLHFAHSREANPRFGLLHCWNLDGCATAPDVVSPILFVVRPDRGIPYLTFAALGQIGGLCGMNAAGLTVSTTALLDVAEQFSATAARLPSSIVQNILEAATDVETAIEIIKRNPGCVACGICISDYRADRLSHLEYDRHLLKTKPWLPQFVAANHRLMQTIPTPPPPDLAPRFERLQELLGGDCPDEVSPWRAMCVLRDRQFETHTQLSVVMQPSEGSLWLCAGAANVDDVFCEIRMGDVFADKGRTPLELTRAPVRSVNASVERCSPKWPLINSLTQTTPAEPVLANCLLEPARDVFLEQHRFNGRPLLPLAIMVELLLETAAAMADSKLQIAELRDVTVLSGLRFLSDEPQTVRVSAKRSNTTIQAQLTADLRNRSGALLLADKPLIRGTIVLAPAGEITNAVDPRVIARPGQGLHWEHCVFTENGVIYHGPIFRGLRAMALEGDLSWGHAVSTPVETLNTSRRGREWVINPLLLDACLYACGSTLWLKNRGTIALPDGFQQLQFGRLPRPNEKCLVAVRDLGRVGKSNSYDFSAYGEDGELLLDVAGYRNTIAAAEPGFHNMKRNARDGELFAYESHESTRI